MQAKKKTTTIKESAHFKGGFNLAPLQEAAADRSAIEAGHKPLESRRRDAAALKARASELYGIPPSGLPAIPAIEAAFRFSPQPSDEELHPLHADALLEEAAELLRQCAAERGERDRLHLERWKLQLELDEFFRIDQIREKERQAGLNTLAYQRAVLDSEAERSLEEHYRNSEAQLKSLLDDLLASGFNKRMAARELTAWISAYPLKDSELGGDEAIFTFDNTRKSKPDHLYDAARLEVDQAAWEQAFTLLSERYRAQAESDAGRLRKESLMLMADWSRADIKFRSDREQTARDAVWEKVFQVQSAGGLLNYQERIAPRERSFSILFREAMARVLAAQRGLKDLYDYNAPLPKEGVPGYFDELVLWVGSARSRAAQFAKLDQEYVLVVSMKEAASGQWEAGRPASQWTFDIGEALFPSQAHVRLRGIGITVSTVKSEELEPGRRGGHKAAATHSDGVIPDASKTEGFWSARVSAPRTGTVRLLSGSTRELDQSSLPICFLGRIAAQDAPHSPELAGACALYNASPIGKGWQISLSPKSTAGTPTEKLDDIQLHLHVAVRSVRGKA